MDMAHHDVISSTELFKQTIASASAAASNVKSKIQIKTGFSLDEAMRTLGFTEKPTVEDVQTVSLQNYFFSFSHVRV